MSIKTSKNNNFSKTVTLKALGEFTEEVILPGVEKIVEDRVGPIEQKMDALVNKVDHLTETVKTGFATIGRSIQVLAGDSKEIKEAVKESQEKELKYENRLNLVEKRVGVR